MCRATPAFFKMMFYSLHVHFLMVFFEHIKKGIVTGPLPEEAFDHNMDDIDVGLLGHICQKSFDCPFFLGIKQWKLMIILIIVMDFPRFYRAFFGLVIQ